MEIEKLKLKFPFIDRMINDEEIFWFNDRKDEEIELPVDPEDTDIAEQRLFRFASYISKIFPETDEMGGIIESPLVEISSMKEALEKEHGVRIPGRLFLKCDSHMPVSGSVKARGGIYEVLKFAEEVAMDHGMLKVTDSYDILTEERFKKLFGEYKIVVGSTGNLGLSIGLMGAVLGFRVIVHMSSDARQWKKDLLRQKGVTVVEHSGDYQMAVAEGRKSAEADNYCHFVDDENSMDLLLGYSVAGRRIAEQFRRQQIKVDEDHPLFVYLPCGVGGAPSGIAFGMINEFGKHTHCFFAEPTHAPAMTLGLMTGLRSGISAADVGIDPKTIADGLAVARPSESAARVLQMYSDGGYTLNDNTMLKYLRLLYDSEGIFIEPSACAAFGGLPKIVTEEAYLIKNSMKNKMENVTHIIWATGGSMVPPEEKDACYKLSL